jgi:ketosteroid isomerase-like protein
MKRSRFVAAGIGVLVVVLIGGCQSAPKGPSDEELIAAVIANWQTAITGKDVDGIMALYSENFAGSQGEDKAGTRTFLEQAMAMGYLDGIEVDAAGAETTIEEGTATVGPISATTMMGTASLTFKLAKEEDGWLFVGSEMQQ